VRAEPLQKPGEKALAPVIVLTLSLKLPSPLRSNRIEEPTSLGWTS